MRLNWLRIAIAPLLGAVIGYITNDLALKMLFRPYEEVRIGRFHVPFTPGLIPSQKGRIAKALGSVIAGKLLDADTLGGEALSDAAMDRLRGAISGWLEGQAADERTLRERLEPRVGPERLDELEGAAADRAADFLSERLRGAGLGDTVADLVIESIQSKLARLRVNRLLEGTMDSLRAAVARAVERRLAEAAPRLLREKLRAAERELLAKSPAELTEGHRDGIPALTEALLGIYREILENHLGSMLAAARLDEVIERRIESFDARTLEAVVFGVMRRELRAIVYLGALLGFVMGFVNLLF